MWRVIGCRSGALVSAVIQAGSSFRIVSAWLDDESLDVVICPTLLGEDLAASIWRGVKCCTRR